MNENCKEWERGFLEDTETVEEKIKDAMEASNAGILSLNSDKEKQSHTFQLLTETKKLLGEYLKNFKK